MPLIIPDARRIKYLGEIQKRLLDYKDEKNHQSLVVACSEMVKQPDFAEILRHNPHFSGGVNENNLTDLAWSFFMHNAAKGDFISAALTLWDIKTFSPMPRQTQLVWNALFSSRKICLIGGGGLGKTYSPSAYFMIQWILDPQWTRLQVASASEDHLEKNLYADICRLYDGASLELPGTKDSKGISLDKKSGMGIFTLVLPGGPKPKAKIKGAHTKPRPAHPLYGDRSRVFMIVDEAQEVPQNIYNEIPNRFSTVEEHDMEHIKFVVCANPKDKFSEFGKLAKPREGWDQQDPNTETWISEQGWTVVCLNAMKHENVQQKRQVYPGMVTHTGVNDWLRKCNGDDQHPDMYTYVFGRFPPEGTQQTIIKQTHLAASEGEWIFDTRTDVKIGFDPALTGDLPALATGRTGRAIGWMSLDGTRHDLPEPRIAIQIDSIGILPHGDTQDMVDEVFDRCKSLQVRPQHYGQDSTGNAIGIHDVIRRQWKDKIGPLEGGLDRAPIHGINFSQMATEHKIADEDTLTPKDLYDGIASELWFAAARLFEYGVIKCGRGVDPKAFEELGSRRGGTKIGKGKKQCVESKDVYRARTGLSSPDKADSITILLHVCRLTTENLIPRAKDTKSEAPPPRDPWGNFTLTQEAMPMRGYQGHTVLEGMRD